MEVTEVQKITQNVIAEASKVVIAGEAVVEKLLVALLAGGHVLLEDRPGSGKTTLAKTFARLLDVEQKRVQFTPDLMPSDITGLNVYSQKDGEFHLVKGPVFTNVLLADEINRATPRTQASLLDGGKAGDDRWRNIAACGAFFGSCNGEPDRDNRNLSTSGSTSGSFHDEAFNGTAGYAGEAARDGDFYGGTSASFSETGLHGGADCTDARSCKNGNCTSVYPGVHRPDCGGNRKKSGHHDRGQYTCDVSACACITMLCGNAGKNICDTR